MQILQCKNSRRLEIIFFSIFLLILPFVSANVIMNEIMPHSNNSLGDEWIELYNPSAENLTLINWKIGDRNSNDTINLTIYSESYALIVDSTTVHCSAINISNESCIELATIGSGLNDDNETIYLYNYSILIDSFSWNYSIKSKGKSFSFLDSSWNECIPTPGLQNNCSQSQEQEQNQSNQTNPTISINYPSEVLNNGTEFNVTLNISYFDPAIYDMKIEVKNDTSNIGKILAGEEWQSTFYWVYNAFSLGSSEFIHIARLKIDPEKSFSGVASIQAKVRKTNTSEIFESSSFNLNVLLSAPPQEEEENESQQDYEYIITNIPSIINESNTNFTIQVRIINNKNETKTFDVWSYVYRGSKCYSQDREANKKTITIKANNENSTELENQLQIGEIKENSDNYKFKVKVLRTEIKTPKEFTYNLTISISINDSKSDVTSTQSDEILTKTDENNETSPESKEEFLNNPALIAEYISKSEKIKGLAPYMFAVCCIAIAAPS